MSSDGGEPGGPFDHLPTAGEAYDPVVAARFGLLEAVEPPDRRVPDAELIDTPADLGSPATSGGPRLPLTDRPALVPDLERDRLWPLVAAAAVAALVAAGATLALLGANPGSDLQAIESADDPARADDPADGPGRDPAPDEEPGDGQPRPGGGGPAGAGSPVPTVAGDTAVAVQPGSVPGGSDPGPGTDDRDRAPSGGEPDRAGPEDAGSTTPTDPPAPSSSTGSDSSTGATTDATDPDGPTTSASVDTGGTSSTGTGSTSTTSAGQVVTIQGTLTEVFTDCSSHLVLVGNDVVDQGPVSCDGGSWIKVDQTMIRTSSGLVPVEQSYDRHDPTLLPGTAVVVTALSETGSGLLTLDCPSCRITRG